jgi:hypothetical protein
MSQHIGIGLYEHMLKAYYIYKDSSLTAKSMRGFPRKIWYLAENTLALQKLFERYLALNERSFFHLKSISELDPEPDIYFLKSTSNIGRRFILQVEMYAQLIQDEDLPDHLLDWYLAENSSLLDQLAHPYFHNIRENELAMIPILSDSQISTLNQNGFRTLKSIADSTEDDLNSILGLDSYSIGAIISLAQQLIDYLPISGYWGMGEYFSSKEYPEDFFIRYEWPHWAEISRKAYELSGMRCAPYDLHRWLSRVTIELQKKFGRYLNLRQKTYFHVTERDDCDIRSLVYQGIMPTKSEVDLDSYYIYKRGLSLRDLHWAWAENILLLEHLSDPDRYGVYENQLALINFLDEYDIIMLEQAGITSLRAVADSDPYDIFSALGTGTIANIPDYSFGNDFFVTVEFLVDYSRFLIDGGHMQFKDEYISPVVNQDVCNLTLIRGMRGFSAYRLVRNGVTSLHIFSQMSANDVIAIIDFISPETANEWINAAGCLSNAGIADYYAAINLPLARKIGGISPWTAAHLYQIGIRSIEEFIGKMNSQVRNEYFPSMTDAQLIGLMKEALLSLGINVDELDDREGFEPPKYDILNYKVNKSEFWFLVFNPGCIIPIGMCQDRAWDLGNSNFPGMEDDNTRKNAFVHAYWNCCMTKRIGLENAETFATYHELNYNPINQRVMDLYNNYIGRTLATKPWELLGPVSPDLSCEQLVLMAIDRNILVENPNSIPIDYNLQVATAVLPSNVPW